MSGRKARQAREARARMNAAAPCDCGYYPHDFLTPCGFLAWCSAIKKAGFCSQCGYRLIRRVGWDSSMQCVVRQERCPRGCQHGMVWVRPEDATADELKRCGLVLIKEPASRAPEE